jgi:1-hydroxycarotenoid 3,4-desaturase
MGRPAPRALVIGGGIAGLCAALELNAQGCAVTVLERAMQTGGKLHGNASPIGLVDAGPTVLTLKGLFESFLGSAGVELSGHLRLAPLEVLARHAWSRSERLDLHGDVERSAEAIRAFAGARDAAGYLRFCRDSREIYETFSRRFLCAEQPGLAAVLAGGGLAQLRRLWRARPFTSLWKALAGYFPDPRLRQLFGRYATYCGSSPFRAPATLMLVAHVEQAGVWRVEGGMHELARALTALLEARGVDVRCSCHVQRIITDRQRACGVELANGERLEGAVVLATCDTAALSEGLLGAAVQGAAAPVAERSLSAMTWTGAVVTRGFELLHHNVFFGTDYAREFAALERGDWTEPSPTIYVCAQDRAGAGLPAGTPERLLCLRNAPAIGDRHEFDPTEVRACLDQTLQVLGERGLEIPEAHSALVARTPSDFARMFPGSGGALYGPATHGWRASFRRPGARSKVAGLYLAGGSTHPGPGLPMAALSAHTAARCALKDLGLMSR